MKVLLLEPLTRWIKTLGTRFSLAYPALAGALREEGIDVAIYDPHTEDGGWNEIRREINRESPDVVAVGCNATSNAYRAIETIEFVKEVAPEVVTVGGGVFFSSYPEESMDLCGALDFVVLGEGERTLVELVRAIEKKRGGSYEDVPGIVFKKNGMPVRTQPRPLIARLDDLPLPAYDLVPVTQLDSYWLKKEHRKGATDYMMMVTSRGCPWACNFCTQWKHFGRTWRGFSAKRVASEVELLQKEYGKTVFAFGDNEFNFDRQRVLDFADEIKSRGIRIRYSMESRVDLLLRDRDILGRMVRSGLIHVGVGMDATASDAALRHVNKGISLEQIKACAKMLRTEYPELIVQWFVIIGNRTDTREAIEETVRFLTEEVALDIANFFIVTPHPGTDLWNEGRAKGWIQSTNFSRYDETNAIMPTETLSREEVNELLKDCYYKYYSHPTTERRLKSSFLYKREFVKAIIRKRWDEGGWDAPAFLRD